MFLETKQLGALIMIVIQHFFDLKAKIDSL